MASSDKLIPNAITIANNLHGVKYSTSGFFKQPSKKINKYNNPLIDAIKFIASIYAKEVKVANSNATWDYRLIDGAPQKDVFTPDQNTHHLNLGMVVAISEDEWNELQITISKVINNIYPLSNSYYTAYTPAEYQSYMDLMGIQSKGAAPGAFIYDANGTVIPGPGFGGTWPQGMSYVNGWNTVKVPTDAALGVETPFIAPIYKPAGETNNFYRYTGIRRWFGFDGYDSY